MAGRATYFAGTGLAAVLALTSLALTVPEFGALRAASPAGASDVEFTDHAGMSTDEAGAPAPAAAAPLPAAPVEAPAPAAPAAAEAPAPAADAAALPAPAVAPPAAVEAAPAPAPETAAVPAPAPEPAPANQPDAAEAAPAPAAVPPAAAAVAPVEPAPAAPSAAAPSAAAPAGVVPVPANAPAAAGTPAPAAESVATVPADPVAAAVLARLAEKGAARFTQREAEQAALATFYGARNGAPLFTAADGPTALGRAATARFAAAAEDGLSPADYVVAFAPASADATDLADAELRFAATVLTYARHAQSGRFVPSRISANVDPTPTPPDALAVLSALAASGDPAVVLASFAPQYPGYLALKAELAKLRANADAVTPDPIPAGKLLRPGKEDARVPLLRARLKVPGDATSLVYDHDLAEAVKAFQKSAGLTASGALDQPTVARLNDTGEARINDVIANMERWRWLPHDVAPTYVLVNIPEYMVRIVKDGQPFHETKVIVGKPQNPTPLLTQDMQYIVFNPAWNVPPGIARKEMLPKLAADPYALARQGIDVVRNGRVVDPGMVDWSRGTQGYSFRQPPGERNALGNIKFMFPNKHSVYLHDTPSRSLFANARRAYSHGCVRVFEPLKFGEAIFAAGMPNDPWSQQRIAKMKGGSERYVNLKQRFPVHLAYFTSFVNGAGNLVTVEDLYGINAQTKLMLGLEGTRRVADRTVRPLPRP